MGTATHPLDVTFIDDEELVSPSTSATILGAVTFDAILKRIKAKFVLGLAATPIRRNGQQPVIFMQCGPIRYTAVKPANAPHNLEVVPRSRLTHIDLPPETGIQDVFRHITNDGARTDAIATEIINAFEQGRKVLLKSCQSTMRQTP